MKRKSTIRFNRPINKTKPPTAPIELEITDLSHDGRGVGRWQGKACFISGALPGERVSARIEQQHKRFNEGSTLTLLQPSPQRQAPFCHYYQHCGGCQLQHLEAKAQVAYKEAHALHLLEKIAAIRPDQVAAPLTGPERGYRRAARIGLNVRRDGQPIVGFRRAGSNQLLNIDHCPILAPCAATLPGALQQLLGTLANPKILTHAQLTLGDESRALQLRCTRRPDPDDLQQLQAFARTHQLHLQLRDEQHSTTVHAPETPNEYSLRVTRNGMDSTLQLAFAADDFIQVNAAINQQMITQALDWLQLDRQDHVLDLFCGLGNFTLPLACQAATVTAVEGVAAMVARTQANAARNQLDNIQVFQANLAADIGHQPWADTPYQAVVLDPPRSGALALLQQLPHLGQRLLYIACEPAALARDSQVLAKRGYRLSRFCVLDMFPHTTHIESMALFEPIAKTTRHA